MDRRLSVRRGAVPGNGEATYSLLLPLLNVPEDQRQPVLGQVRRCRSRILPSTQVSWCEIDDGLPRHAEGAPELDKIWVEMEGWSTPE